MTHGRFNENLYLDRDFTEIWGNFKSQSRLSNITVWDLSLNLDFRKYEQKWMPRWLEPNYIRDSRIFWDASNFEIQLQNASQSGNQRFRSNFFPQLRTLRSGLVGVGPRYALFFYLLRCRWFVRFVEWCTRSGQNMLNAELISHHLRHTAAAGGFNWKFVFPVLWLKNCCLPPNQSGFCSCSGCLHIAFLVLLI